MRYLQLPQHYAFQDKKWCVLLILIFSGFYSATAQFTSEFLRDVGVLGVNVREKGAPFEIFMEIDGPAFDYIEILNYRLLTFFNLDGSPVEEVKLYDDGTHGDQVAGDNIYTRGGFTFDHPNRDRNITGSIMFRDVLVQYNLNNEVYAGETLDLATAVAFYDASIPLPEVTQINDEIQYTDLVVNVKRPAKWGEEPFPDVDYYRNCPLFNEYFKDGFFGLVQTSTNNQFSGLGAGATFGPSSNFTQGLGKPINDLDLPFLGRITFNWTRAGRHHAPHEFLHKWAGDQRIYNGLLS